MRYLIFFTFMTSQISLPDFQYNEEGEIIVTDVVSTSLDETRLLMNTEEFYQNLNNYSLDSTGKYYSSTSFTLYTKRLGYVPEGKINYVMSVEIRENRYRYILSDFVFTPMEINRYGRYELQKNEASSLRVWLEKENNIKLHKKNILLGVERQLNQMKASIENEKPSVDNSKVVKLSDEW